jgi:hypothetical protein
VTPLVPAILLATALSAPAPPEGGCRPTDLMPAFWRFWEAARGQPSNEQYRLFEDLVRKPNRAVYEGVFEGARKAPADFVPTSFATVPAIEASMRELSRRLSAELPGQLDAFRKAFPRFRCATPVYFVYSAGAFDGAARDVDGKTALMFGLDVIARLKEELSPLVVHELFHIYHGEVLAEDPETVGWALWSEGLATYVSRRLNPKRPESQICCMPAVPDALIPGLAAESLRLLDSTKREDYARFFLGGDELEIPSRSGYAVGYRIASEAGKTRTLEQLAALTPAEVRDLEAVELQRLALLAAAIVATASLASIAAAPPRTDPLAAAIAGWSDYLKSNTSKDEMWLQIKESAAPAMVRVEDAMQGGRRLLALQRLAGVQPDLDASKYLGSLPPADRSSEKAFESAWKRMGQELAKSLGAPSPKALEGVTPAAVRAVGEASVPAVKVFYEASLDYERNTMPEVGFYYLGVARAQRDLGAFCRTLSTPSSLRPPPVRSLHVELDALEGELLAAYRPPASIDRHREFITASSTLKEARELDASGLRYGATLRYLQAVLRVAPLSGKVPEVTADQARTRLAELRPRLSESGGVDQSIGRIFLEAGEADAASAAAGTSPAQASAVVAEVLPRYFAALEPARPRSPAPPATVTVTLVRWPYT